MKEVVMKNKLTAISIVMAAMIAAGAIQGCASGAELVSAKTGAQIWGENCLRCHNSPSPDTFSDVEWDVAGLHMRIRANLTAEETRKVIEFLQSAN